MKNEVTVTITGAPGVGKSTIAQQIAAHLQSLGLPVELRFIYDEHAPRDVDNHTKAMKRVIDKGTTVNVVESLEKRVLTPPAGL